MKRATIAGAFSIPPGTSDLNGYRRWLRSPDFPDWLRVAYLRDRIWIDPSPEPLFTHNQVKSEVMGVLHELTQASGQGYGFVEGACYTNTGADFSCHPDGLYISHHSLREGRVRLVPTGTGDYDEIEGTLDLVLEVVSPSSVEKDTIRLRELYADAGIPEYWLIDARGEELRFDIFKLGAKGYASVRKQPGGWRKSAALGRSSRPARGADPLGNPEFTLEVRH